MDSKKNVMIDIETLGTSFDSVMLSCSLVRFDIETGETFEELEVYFDLEESIKEGFQVNVKTLKWWLEQDIQVLKKQLKDNSCLESLNDISKFIDNTDSVWGNSASFDLGILGNYYDTFNIERPWNFWNENCVRTVSNLNPQIKWDTEFVGDKHNPIDDCKHQIKYLVETLKSLNHG